MTKFNEDSRVKIPAILYLCRLGYKYISLKTAVWNTETNIFTDIFKESIARINPDFDRDQAERLLLDTSLLLDNEDGRIKVTTQKELKLLIKILNRDFNMNEVSKEKFFTKNKKPIK